jgi:hypothetical protein
MCEKNKIIEGLDFIFIGLKVSVRLTGMDDIEL